MDLSIAPHSFLPIDLPISREGLNPEPCYLSSGIPVYAFPSSTNDVVMVELFFRHAGSAYQSKPLVAGLTNMLLTEGTHELTATQIAEQQDYCGAVINKNSTRDHAYISLFTLEKHVQSLLPLLKSLVTDAAFEEKQVSWHLEKGKQQLLTSLQQTEFVARRHFFAEVFGQKHPYGSYAEAGDFDSVCSADLKSFFQKHYRQGECQIFLAGNYNESVLQDLDKLFSDTHFSKDESGISLSEIAAFKPGRRLAAVENAVQASLCVGRCIVPQKQEDIYGLIVLNCLFGGYFGSRLMTNLREEKGYTYGVYSVMGGMEQQRYFMVASNVRAEFAEEAMQEIIVEMQKVRNELVTGKELTLAKNYLIGNYLRSIDGVFERAKLKKEQIAKQYPEDFFEQTVKAIKSVSPEQLQRLAQTYLQPDEMVQICAGNETIAFQ